MKKTSQFFLVILAVMIAGLFWRITGTYLKSKEEKRQAGLKVLENESIAKAQKKLVHDTTEPQKLENDKLKDTILRRKIPTQPQNNNHKREETNRTAGDVEQIQSENSYIETGRKLIAPVSKWPKILEGRWNLDESEVQKEEYWVTHSKVEFLADRNFIMIVNIEYHNGNRNPAVYREHAVVSYLAGGKITGQWQIKEKKILLTSNSCNIKMIDSVNFSSFSKLDKLKIRACEYFQRRVYGTFTDDAYSMDIIKFNTATIEINGTNFLTGAEVNFELKRL